MKNYLIDCLWKSILETVGNMSYLYKLISRAVAYPILEIKRGS